MPPWSRLRPRAAAVHGALRAVCPRPRPARHRRAAPSSLHRTPRLQSATGAVAARSEEHTSELQSLMRISYAVVCLKQKITKSRAHGLAHNSHCVQHGQMELYYRLGKNKRYNKGATTIHAKSSYTR